MVQQDSLNTTIDTLSSIVENVADIHDSILNPTD